MDSTVDFPAIVCAMGDAVIGAGGDGAIRLLRRRRSRRVPMLPSLCLTPSMVISG